MTIDEIRSTVPPMVIWMADGAIREARKAIVKPVAWGTAYEPERINPYNRPEVDVAAEVLFRTFQTCVAHIKNALMDMDGHYEGLTEHYGENYFNAFVAALEKEEGHPVSLRNSDWVLDSL